jgi:DNA (cytosine-5)-methyltransferase 1
MKETAISLFCGAGGCSLGFKQAGYKMLYASDFDKAATETYATNFPETLCETADVNNLNFTSVMRKAGISEGQLDFMVGGPPCQGFSTAGTRFWDDPRNGLLKSYVSALKTVKPKWFLMENVEGLLTAKNGEYLHEAIKAFIAIGYVVRVEKVYSHEYGIPQRRKRVLIVGNRLGIDFKFPEPTIALKGRIFRNSDVTIKHAISGLPSASVKADSKIAYDGQVEDQFEEYLRGTAEFVRDHYSPCLGKLQVARISSLQPGQTMKDLPEHLQHDSFKKRANRRVMDGTPTEKRGGAPSGLKRLCLDEPCLTITGAATREFIHPIFDRPLTIREAARIQTFPDDFVFLGNAQNKIQQIGNAIPPLMAKIFAEHIRDEYGFEERKLETGRLTYYSVTKAGAMSPTLKNTCKLLDGLLKPDVQKLLEI